MITECVEYVDIGALLVCLTVATAFFTWITVWAITSKPWRDEHSNKEEEAAEVDEK